jgi:hypothetical protein
LRNCIAHKYLVDKCVIGDEHWLKFPDQAFSERVRLANASIIEEVKRARGALIVCEWVPVVGAFPDELQRVCSVRGMHFLQVALTAEASILRKRKMIRDGDGDTNKCDTRALSSQNMCLVLDTGDNDVRAMCQGACEWLANKAPQRTPLRSVTEL